MGFYGSGIIVRHGCSGGWRAFGPVRKVTGRAGNVLFELDGKPALEGVETTDQRDWLRQMGANECQGYLFQPPLPVDQLERLIPVLGQAEMTVP